MAVETAEELYEEAPCGYLSMRPDGTIVRLNDTLARWLGADKATILGRRFADLLTVGGKIYNETHLAPLLQMQGSVGGIALDIRTGTGEILPVPINAVTKADLVRVTVFDARDRRAYEQELLRARQTADADRDRLRQLATDLQRSLLPPSLPAVPGVSIAAFYHAASESRVGGDFYDVFPVPSGEPIWGVLLGDVSGKDVTAAALTSRARYTLRAATAFDPDPARGLHLLNTVLEQEQRGLELHFCTVVFGLLTPIASGARLTATSGGHPPPIIVDAAGHVDFLALPRGPLVGALPAAKFRSTTIDLRPGDTVLLYSDGITEARLGEGRDRYGRDRLRAFVAEHAGLDAAGLIDALTGLLSELGDGVDDDVALLALSIDR